jgi:hypothetical protein
MIVKQFKYFPFLLRLNAPFQYSFDIITVRKGFIIFKPTIIGAVDFIKKFENSGEKIIISSSFKRHSYPPLFDLIFT